MKREEAIKQLNMWSMSGNAVPVVAILMAIEALQTAEINCVHCPRYHETEDETGVHSHCGSHGRLIDADALMEYCSNQKTKTISNNDIARFPTIQADRPHREWVEVVERTEQYDREGVKTWATLYQCSNCGFVLNAIEGHIGQYHYCPNCGALMTQYTGGYTE